MDLDHQDSSFTPSLPPALVSLTPFSSSVSSTPRRLSSCFVQNNGPIRAKRQLAWVSLQGRLVGADEASSARTIDKNGVLGVEQATAWELFSPIQRVLIVAVVAVAAVKCSKNKQIVKLQKSVELRDQVLSSMQQKLDNLCEQVNYFKDQPEIITPGNGCKTCQHHQHLMSESVVNPLVKGLKEDEVFKYRIPLIKEVEPEERRMSDLSDWAPSITSSVDIQVDTLGIEQDIYNLRRECEEKDATIKELSSVLKSSEVFGSKRIAELEDIIRRKNMIINKLRKDMLTLEQKVVNLTRMRRPSFYNVSSNTAQLPVMADNVLYDMDSTTSPSSSDSDKSPKKSLQVQKIREISVWPSEESSNEEQKRGPAKNLTSTLKQVERKQRSRTTSPLREKSFNQTPNQVPAHKLKHKSSVGGESRLRSKEVAPPNKRWF